TANSPGSRTRKATASSCGSRWRKVEGSQFCLRLLRQNRQANYGQRHKCERPVIGRAKSPHLGRVDALGNADQYQQAPESPSLTPFQRAVDEQERSQANGKQTAAQCAQQAQ